MARDLIEDPKFKVTTQTDARDPSRFGQLLETTKDAFVLELRKFFDQAQIPSGRRVEVPTIEKYSSGFGAGQDPYETAVTIVRKYPEIHERLPHVAVLAASGAHRPLGFGTLIGTVQYPPKIVGAKTAPFGIVSGDTIVLRTKPNFVDWKTSTLTFYRDTDTMASILHQLRAQALYVSPSDDGAGHLVLETGGVFGRMTPNAIEITSGTALDKLGFVVGQADDHTNVLRPPMNRYAYAWDLSVRVEILTAEETTRGELADLVMGWLSFYLGDKKYTFVGQSVQDPVAGGHLQHWVVTVKPSEIRSSGESEVPRGDDGKDRIYVNAFDAGVTTTMYIDREVLAPTSFTDGWTITDEDINKDDDLPQPS